MVSETKKAKLKLFYNNFPHHSTLHAIEKFLESFLASASSRKHTITLYSYLLYSYVVMK